MGDEHDTCNDLCRYKGYTGCNEATTGELTRQGRMQRVMDHLNMTCAQWSSNNYFPSYTANNAQCYKLKTAIDCDRNPSVAHRPVCECSDTTSTTTLSVARLQLTLDLLNFKLGASVRFISALLGSKSESRLEGEFDGGGCCELKSN